MKFKTIFFCILFKIFYIINCTGEYMPVLIWTNSRISHEPVLTLNKINSRLFANYIESKLSDRKALVLLFLEQILTLSDFDDGYQNLRCPFDFLKSIRERVDFFPNVQLPYESFQNLSVRNRNWTRIRDECKIPKNDLGIFVMEFQNIDDDKRELELKRHEEIMANMTELLKKRENDWMCIYTGRHTRSDHYFAQLRSWKADPEPSTTSWRALYLYKDEIYGFGLLTKGPILLHLPNGKNHTIKALEEHTGVSFAVTGDTLDLILSFSNYILSISMSLLNEEWTMDSVTIQNENGQTLKLLPKIPADPNAKLNEFHSREQPSVKISLSKYKVFQTQEEDGSCTNIYAIPILCTIMFTSVILISLIWGAFMGTFKISESTDEQSKRDL